MELLRGTYVIATERNMRAPICGERQPGWPIWSHTTIWPLQPVRSPSIVPIPQSSTSLEHLYSLDQFDGGEGQKELWAVRFPQVVCDHWGTGA
jgi:hypothetical protein